MKAKSFDFKLVVRTSFWNCKENAKKKETQKNGGASLQLSSFYRSKNGF
jgi:hypothetical protein